MDDVLRHAKRLGEAIAAHERCTALRKAAAALKGDDEASRLQRDYAEAAQVLHEKEQAGQALEPEEKRRELELRQKMAAHPLVRDFLRAQADFSELMQKTNEAVEESIGLE